MIRFIVRRLGFIALVLLISSALIFGATQVLPDDVARMILGQFATDEAIKNLREQLGLNRPLLEQYFSWLGNFVTGDWGVSLSTGAAGGGTHFRTARQFPSPGRACVPDLRSGGESSWVCLRR